jgi:hypothetical protein
MTSLGKQVAPIELQSRVDVPGYAVSGPADPVGVEHRVELILQQSALCGGNGASAPMAASSDTQVLPIWLTSGSELPA